MKTKFKVFKIIKNLYSNFDINILYSFIKSQKMNLLLINHKIFKLNILYHE